MSGPLPFFYQPNVSGVSSIRMMGSLSVGRRTPVIVFFTSTGSSSPLCPCSCTLLPRPTGDSVTPTTRVKVFVTPLSTVPFDSSHREGRHHPPRPGGFTSLCVFRPKVKRQGTTSVDSFLHRLPLRVVGDCKDPSRVVKTQ